MWQPQGNDVVTGAGDTAALGARAHLVGLGLVAIVCAFGSAFANRGAARPAPHADPKIGSALEQILPVRPLPARDVHAGRLSCVLAAMVAPVRTVRLPAPLRQRPSLHLDGFVFPLPESFFVADTFGAPRPEGWHHGDDLFAPRGTPVRAVADGVIFSVGWQRLGGRRLWLRDRAGNEFYYAHLDRYSASARDGRPVQAGEVIAFVGNSGDAEATPPHLHFEIHPASLLSLGYDGAVDPTPYLRSWRRLDATSATIAAKPGARASRCG
jgi:murein DD-endopeptidase MepM/ murein hydrolase activator NlpD